MTSGVFRKTILINKLSIFKRICDYEGICSKKRNGRRGHMKCIDCVQTVEKQSLESCQFQQCLEQNYIPKFQILIRPNLVCVTDTAFQVRSLLLTCQGDAVHTLCRQGRPREKQETKFSHKLPLPTGQACGGGPFLFDLVGYLIVLFLLWDTVWMFSARSILKQSPVITISSCSHFPV